MVLSSAPVPNDSGKNNGVGRDIKVVLCQLN